MVKVRGMNILDNIFYRTFRILRKRNDAIDVSGAMAAFCVGGLVAAVLMVAYKTVLELGILHQGPNVAHEKGIVQIYTLIMIGLAYLYFIHSKRYVAIYRYYSKETKRQKWLRRITALLAVLSVGAFALWCAFYFN
jgi:hypothetical protein